MKSILVLCIFGFLQLCSSDSAPEHDITPVAPQHFINDHTYKVETNHSTACILARFNATIVIKNSEKNENHTLIVDDWKISNNSSCNGGDKNEDIILSIDNSKQTVDVNDVATLTFTFAMDETNKFLKQIELKWQHIDGVYQEKVFKSPLGNSYFCHSNVTFSLSNEQNYTVTLEMNDVHIDAFRDEKLKADEFHADSVCSVDNPISDIVPIAVAVALILLIVILLIGYSVFRRRSDWSIYQSV